MKSYSDLLDQIQEIRARNNKTWIDIVRLAFKHAPREARVLMRRITEADQEIGKLSKQLGEGDYGEVNGGEENLDETERWEREKEQVEISEESSIRFYRVGFGDNLTKLKAPCVLFVANSNTYHWYNGWNPPTDWSTKIPEELGKFVKEKLNGQEEKGAEGNSDETSSTSGHEGSNLWKGPSTEGISQE